MSERIRNVGLYLRTAYFVANLRQLSGLGAGRIEERIRRNQYAPYGLQAPSESTVRDYFLVRRSPAVDPQRGNEAPWLFAADLEFPGGAYAFFHPIFDLLLGQVDSSLPWRGRLQRIPDAWIDEAEARGDKDQANEWRHFNSISEPKRGRPSRREPHDQLAFIHLTMLRLPDVLRGQLFSREGLATTFRRRYLPIDDEVGCLRGRGDMEALSALIGLVQEAAQIGDSARLRVSKQAVTEHLAKHGFVSAAHRIERRLRFLIESEVCLGLQGRRYDAAEMLGFGLPATWRTRAFQFEIERQAQHMLPCGGVAGANGRGDVT